MRRLSSAVLAGLLAACSGPEPGGPALAARVPLDEVFRLRVGQTASVAETGIRITFQRVVDDSRCPTNVLCVWEGNAQVVLQLEGDSVPAVAGLNTGVVPRSASYAGYVIALTALDPYPEEPGSIPAERYVASLRVSMADRRTGS